MTAEIIGCFGRKKEGSRRRIAVRRGGGGDWKSAAVELYLRGRLFMDGGVGLLFGICPL